MPKMVMHREPVALIMPGTSVSVGMHRGKELDDDSPFCTDPAFAWLFEDDGAGDQGAQVDRAGAEPPIETGQARPGEVRRTRRDRP